MASALFRDLSILIARIGLGVVFVAHGWQKFFEFGVNATQASFADMGVPLPDISAIAAATIELAGGFALIVGLATPVAGFLLFLDMLGALILVHADKGVFVSEGGYELVVALGVGSLLLAVIGAGRLGIDGLIGRGAGWGRAAV
ncbi:DoxX family protein [Rhodococcus tibetensis]|uniref:DoxX family protein n=1 Tax=Rhodococcus tibetensis TaxID=2965064 RepID=A0ABT1Q7M8_9NOCA|nr:DoxX family protein [Rhodococcus sp. FXJ9.536]MCQ4118262.1 DoxX family protein [Rhodococcus sp. FXJ9.536]